MIRYLKVKGLNNRLDNEFKFNEDLNIFTGANGSGKTTLLKLIRYLISGNLNQILAQIPFHSIAIQTDLFALSMERVEPDRVTL
ncbi:AAA family ATPase, partial [Candidatus Poribacteria bacterium]|nr:AAA family ATPase [Candidatus Poribacteria bacterium]